MVAQRTSASSRVQTAQFIAAAAIVQVFPAPQVSENGLIALKDSPDGILLMRARSSIPGEGREPFLVMFKCEPSNSTQLMLLNRKL